MQWLLDWLTNSENLKAILPIISTILTFILGGLVLQVVLPAVKDWRRRRRNRQIPAGNLSLLVLAPGSKNALWQLMGGREDNKDDPLADFNITYQQRVAEREIRKELETALQQNDWVLVVGKTGIGKSREIYHLAELFNGEGWQLLKLQDKGDMWLDEPKQLSPEIDREQNTLLILDDLNKWVQPGNALELTPMAEDPLQPLRSPVPERLIKILEFHQRELRRDLKVIATARNEQEEWAKLQIEKYPELWKRFHQYTLPEPEDHAIIQLLKDRVDNAKMIGKESDYPQIAAHNDRTFRNIIENLQIAKNRQLTIEQGQFTENLTATWREQYRLAMKKHSATRYIYDAVELLQELNLHLHPQLVIEIARFTCQERGVKRFITWWQMPKLVNDLSQNEGILQPRDGQIQVKDTPRLRVEKISPQLVPLLSRMKRHYSLELLASELFILGYALGNSGRDEEALSSYNQIIKLKPYDSRSWYNHGIVLNRLGRYKEAMTSYDKSIELEPNRHKAWYNRGNTLIKLGRHDEAIASYSEAIELKSNYNQALKNLDKTQLYLSDRTIHKVAHDPGHHQNRLLRGVNLLIVLDLDEEESGESWQTKNRYYPVESKLKNYTDLEEKFIELEEKIKTEPNNVRFWYEHGHALCNLGEYDRAIRSFNKVIEFNHNHYRAYYSKGCILSHLGAYSEAISNYNKAIEFNPDYYEAWYNRGIDLDNLGEYDEAVASYDKAIEIEPDFHKAWNNRGYTLSCLGRYSEAISNYNIAIALNPNNCCQSWNNRGIAMRNLGEFEEAILNYQQALSIQPYAASALYNLACVYALQDDISNALLYLHQAIQLEPEEYTDRARQDKDFHLMRHDSRFIALVS